MRRQVFPLFQSTVFLHSQFQSKITYFFEPIVAFVYNMESRQQKEPNDFNTVKWWRFIPFLSKLLEASKLISQINEWEMRCQRNANKASKQQIAIRFTGDRQSEKYDLICVLYTSLPVTANSILFTDWSLYESQVEENLTSESFGATPSIIHNVKKSELRPLPAYQSDLFGLRVGRSCCEWTGWFVHL